MLIVPTVGSRGPSYYKYLFVVKSHGMIHAVAWPSYLKGTFKLFDIDDVFRIRRSCWGSFNHFPLFYNDENIYVNNTKSKQTSFDFPWFLCKSLLHGLDNFSQPIFSTYLLFLLLLFSWPLVLLTLFLWGAFVWLQIWIAQIKSDFAFMLIFILLRNTLRQRCLCLLTLII